MKISNSKKQLAKIISENGGWREGAEFAAQDQDGDVFFYKTKPTRFECVWRHQGVLGGDWISCGNAQPNWHQTILSRDEYFHLYPAPNADGWIEWKGGECPCPDEYGIAKRRDGVEIPFSKQKKREWSHGESLVPDFQIVAYRVLDHEHQESANSKLITVEPKPTIEQLAAEYRNRKDYAERKQQEADAAKAEAEAKLAELVAAGKAVGLVVSVGAPEPELVITDWRDLRSGDIIEATCYGDERDENDWPGGWANSLIGGVFSVLSVDDAGIHVDEESPLNPVKSWDTGKSFKFIRRPAKEADNA